MAMDQMTPAPRRRGRTAARAERDRRADAVAAMNAAARAEFNANDFLAIVSHDLRLPVAAIAAVAAVMRQRAAARAGGRRPLEVWAADLRRHTAGMRKLIEDLEAGTAARGRLRLTRARHDVSLLIDQAIELLAPAAAAKSIALTRDVAAPLVVDCDPWRILQLVSNLLDNAIKFTPPYGSIRVRLVCHGRDCLVAIVDTGSGIPPRSLGWLVGRATGGAPPAAGRRALGLYVSRAIVDAHGGRIWAESRVGEGSTFFFTLPMRSAPKSRPGK